MSLRATEGHLPDGLLASHFGEAFESAGLALISYLTSPLHTGVTQDYVVMRLRSDGPTVTGFRWAFSNGAMTDETPETAGWLQIVPRHEGTLRVVCEVSISGSSTPITLALTQTVDRGMPAIRQFLWDVNDFGEGYTGRAITREIMSQVGDPAATREVFEDLHGYVLRGAQLTGVKGIPPRMLGSIVYNETLHRPKEHDLSRPWWSVIGWLTAAKDTVLAGKGEYIDEAIREKELIDEAEILNAGGGRGGTSLGVCQIQQQTAAMALDPALWRQRTIDEDDGVPADKDRAEAYDELAPAKKIDIYNHLRFPKSNIALAGKLLGMIKNRENRWPELSWGVFENDHEAPQIIMHEWNIGPTSSKQVDALARLREGYPLGHDYGPRVFAQVYCHPLFRERFAVVSNSPLELGGSVGPGVSPPNADDILRLKRRLHGLGFNWMPINGTLDSTTVTIIQLFQSIINRLESIPPSDPRIDGRVDVPGQLGKAYHWLRAANAPQWTNMPTVIQNARFVNHAVKNTADTAQAFYGTTWLRDLIMAAARSYTSDHLATNQDAAPFTLNRASKPQGGPISPHKGHQTGTVCDILLPRLDGGTGSVKYFHSTYDRAASRAILTALHAAPNFEVAIFNDPILVAEGLCDADPTDPNDQPGEADDPNFPDSHIHDNHIHVELRVPAPL